jgi:hypothetical protein
LNAPVSKHEMLATKEHSSISIAREQVSLSAEIIPKFQRII